MEVVVLELEKRVSELEDGVLEVENEVLELEDGVSELENEVLELEDRVSEPEDNVSVMYSSEEASEVYIWVVSFGIRSV